ncbi:Arylsulfatase [Pontiella desulfatans]|uniref:Arylsulfatase n=1 Tax=Pontiella desulfatans TaxID=2750659 RepID=A0A6C2U2H6_PONDE|nr:arylsulfatase [Pontiella desulfatans]SPS73926.1 sulfatase S1_32 [Kiritimatiellales bacterium]VGO14180.1 Arylsulfatase [Pontiella desulfatans]
MKKIIRISVLLCVFPALSILAERPNIVILLADDLGWADVGFHGSEIKTPNLDSLAQAGVQLKQFYVQPTCSPTRIALMTGRYPFRCGGHISVLRPWHQHGVPLDETLIAQVMKDAGYKTAITGKWHLGLARRAYWPTSRGFDLAHGCLGGAIDYFTHEGYDSLDWYDQDTIPLHEEGYSTDLIGTRASKIIIDHNFDQQPLFLYVPFNAPHSPYQAKEADIEKYSHIKDENRRIYCAMVDSMDQQIGNIIQSLKSKEVLENTLIFFASDNGGAGNSINLPYRGNKGTPYEGGVRVPSFIHWPKGLEGGRDFDRPLHIVDLFPTFTELAQGDIAKCKPLDGINFWPALAEGKAMPKRDIIHNAKDARGRGSIRSGDWKLILSKPERAPDGMPVADGKLMAELFNIKDDPYEQNNVVHQHPEMLETLWGRLKKRAPEIVSAAPYIARAPEGWEAPADWSNAPE